MLQRATERPIGGREARVFVVVPAFQEEERIGLVVDSLVQKGVHVIVVDDGSRDETGSRAGQAGAFVLRHIVNRGQGAALQTGIQWALLQGADIVVTFDADAQHDVADLEGVVLPIKQEKCAVVLGSRFLGRAPGIPWSRRAMLKAALLFTRIATRMNITDVHNGFRAFSRAAAEQLYLTVDRMGHASEILEQVSRKRLSYVEVPVTVRYTDASLRKGQKNAAAFRIVLDLFFRRGDS